MAKYEGYKAAHSTTARPLIQPQHYDYQSCGSCGQAIGKTQQYTQVFNTRFKMFEFYHADYRGCVDATHRRNSRPRVVLNRFRRGLNEILYGDMSNEMDYDRESLSDE